MTFLHPYFAMSKLKYSMQDRQKPFSEFQQTTAVEISLTDILVAKFGPTLIKYSLNLLLISVGLVIKISFALK